MPSSKFSDIDREVILPTRFAILKKTRPASSTWGTLDAGYLSMNKLWGNLPIQRLHSLGGPMQTPLNNSVLQW